MQKTAFTRQGIRIGEQELPLYSGSVHYWRHRREDWPRLLEQVRMMGFSIVETYVPWSVHEPSKGRYDFDGNRDIDAFLSLCEQEGLWVIVRPGPHINAEMTLFGYPSWILWDREIQAQSPQGTPVIYPHFAKPFPIPSYASEKLYAQTAQYFRALRPMLEKHVWPNGCVVAAQADNELCYFFRDSAYVLDYAPDSVRLYRRMLKEDYGEIAALNVAYGASYRSFDEVEPPASYTASCPARGVDWVRYKEYQVLYGVGRMRDLLAAAGLKGIATFHNCAYQHYTPISVQRCEEIVEVAGIDAYGEPNDVSMLRTRIRYLAGSSRLPFVPEFGSGSWFDRGCVLTARQEEYAYLYALMNGMKAVNFYMLAERDRWLGCPLRQDGQPRQEYFAMMRGLLTLLRSTGLHTYQREVSVLLLKDYDMGRRKAAYAAGDYAPMISNCFVAETQFPRELFKPAQKDPLIPDGALHQWWDEPWIDACARALGNTPYDLSDRFLPPDRWAKYRIIYASVNPETDESTQLALLKRVRLGTHVVVGTRLPELIREALRGKAAVSIGEGILESTDAPQAASPSDARVRCDDPQVEVSTFVNAAGDILCFAANTGAQDKQAALNFRGAYDFRGLWRAGDARGKGRVTVDIPADTVALWRMEGAE